MDGPRTRNRRLVTYGTGKGQACSSTDRDAHSASTKTSSNRKSLPISPRLSRSLNTGPESKKDEAHAPETSGTTTTPVRAQPQSQSTTASNVYDIPSSDDELSISRRKRRRPSHDTNKHSPVSKRTVKPRDAPSSKSRLEHDGDVVLPSASKKTAPSSGGISKITKGDDQQPGTGSSMYSRAGRPVRNKIEKSSSRDIPRTPAVKSPASSEHEHLGSPKTNQRHPAAGNTTPGRKRLIDSLASTRPALEIPAKSPPASQLSSNPVLQSPKSPKLRVDEDHIESPVQASPATGPPQLRSSGVTYARQRSFLDDMLLEEDVDHTPGTKHRSHSIHRQLMNDAASGARSTVVNEETNDDGSVRSIHELRQAGGNARYRGAVESIFEDIEDTQNSLSGRCNAFVQLCGKLLDPRLKRRFVECNFDKRLVDCLSIDLRVVPTALAFCAYALGSSDGHMSYVLATSAWPKVVEISPILLGIEDDLSEVVSAQSNGLNRPLQKTIQDIVPRISDILFPDPVNLNTSPCNLALHCLKSTISTMQTKGESPGGSSASLFENLMRLLLSESQRCMQQKQLSTASSQKLCMVFSALEALTASPDSLNYEHRSIMEPLSTLHGLFYLKSSHTDIVGQQIQPLLIRVILNVTNSNSAICDEFANQDMVGGLVHMVTTHFGDLTEDTLGQENNSLDSVILALGALINLTEQSEVSRSIFLLSPASGQSFLGRLLHLFTTFVDSISTAHSVLEVHHNVAVGYLAVLLLTLSLDDETRSRIKESLAPNGLATVISTVDEFLQYHQKIEQEVPQLAAQGQQPSGFMTRLQELIAQIRLIER